MPKKAITKKTAKKKVPKKSTLKKAAKKKVLKKKSANKKTGTRKTSAKKSAIAQISPKAGLTKKNLMVEPGPPPTGIPPVEEPTLNEEALGVVTHYYSHLGVAVVQLNKGALRSGNKIHVKGHSTDLTQQVESMEYEHRHIDEASAGQNVGLKVNDHVREHDIVYLVK